LQNIVSPPEDRESLGDSFSVFLGIFERGADECEVGIDQLFLDPQS